MGTIHLYIEVIGTRRHLGGDWEMLPKLVSVPKVLGRGWDLDK